jgi:acetoacetate decarboxylase
MKDPYFVAPPFELKDTTGMLILFKTAPDVLQALVPHPLVPNPDDLVVFYVGCFNVVAPVETSYHEAGIGVPVSFGESPGQFAAYLYLDQVMPIVAGREIWGFPKKDADITYVKEGDKISARVVQDGITLIDATLQLSERVDPIPSQPGLPWYNLKLIPSVKENAPPDVMQLTSVLIESRPKELHRGQATLELASSPSDPLGDIPVLAVLSGDYVVRDSVLGHGDVVFDYLAEAEG